MSANSVNLKIIIFKFSFFLFLPRLKLYDNILLSFDFRGDGKDPNFCKVFLIQICLLTAPYFYSQKLNNQYFKREGEYFSLQTVKQRNVD